MSQQIEYLEVDSLKLEHQSVDSTSLKHVRCRH